MIAHQVGVYFDAALAQLAGPVGRQRAFVEAGQRLHVVGARGEAGVWTFDVEARENIDLPAGPVTGALRLKREPRKPYDTQIEVWLDPARHHLPVKVRQGVSQGGEATELLLRSLGPP